MIYNPPLFMVMGYKDDKYIKAYETFSFTYSLESYTMGAGLALGVRGPIVLCKTCSLLLCVLEQPRVDKSRPSLKIFQFAQTRPMIFGYG
jgi:hypothetical protein